MASIVDGWRPELHPRDEHGRFRNKWKLASAAAALIDGIIAKFDPKTFSSDVEARDYLRQKGGHDYGKHLDPAVTDYLNSGWHDTNAKMRAGTEGLPPGLEKEFKPSEDDLILSRAVGPEAFGLNAQQLDGVQEWTGRLVADKAPGNASIGTPLQSGPGTINLAILAPKGTKMIIPGNGSPDVVYEPGQALRITKVTGDAQNGIHVWAVMTPNLNNKGQPVKTRALGRKLASTEKAAPDQTDVNLPEAQRVQAQTPPSMEDRVKALEEKLATTGGKAGVPAAPTPAKRAKRVPKPPLPTDQPPEGEAPSKLPEKTAAGSATVAGLRATALRSNPTPQDAARLRDKLDGQSVATLRDAAKSLEIKKLGARKQDIVDKIVDHVYGKRTTIPPRTPAEPKKTVKASEKGALPPEVQALRQGSADIAKRAGRPQEIRATEHLTAPPVKHAAEPVEVKAMREAMDKAAKASPAKLRNAAEKAGISVPESKKTSPEIVAHVVDAVTTGKVSVPSVPAKKATTKAVPSAPTAPEVPAAQTPSGATFKEAFTKASKGIGLPEPGPRRAEFNRAYFKAARGKFAEAHTDLKEDIDKNQAALDDLKANDPQSPDIAKLDHDLRAQIRLAAFINDHSKGTKKLEAPKPEAPAVLPVEDKGSNDALKAYSTTSRVRKSVEADPTPENMLAGAIEHDQAANYFRKQARLAGERADLQRKGLEAKGRPNPDKIKEIEKERAGAVKSFNNQEEAHRQAAASLRDRAKDESVRRQRAIQQAGQARTEAAAAKAAAKPKTRFLLEEVNSRGGTVRVLGGALTHDEAVRKHKELGDRLTAEANKNRRPADPELKRHGDVKITEVTPDQTERYRLAGQNAMKKPGEEMLQPADLKAKQTKQAARGSKSGQRLADLRHRDNGTIEPPPQDKRIDPATYFDARQPSYQDKIDEAQGAAKLAGRLQHIAANVDNKDLQRHLDEALKPDTNAPTTHEAVARWNAAVDLRGEKITNRAELNKAIDKLAEKHGLKPIGEAGDTVPYNPRLHQGSPDMKPGERVHVDVPGYWRAKGADDPRAKAQPTDVLAKAQVSEPGSTIPGVPKGHVLKPTEQLPSNVQQAIKTLGNGKPADLRKAADKMGIPVPENLKTSDEIARHVVADMAGKELSARGRNSEVEARIKTAYAELRAKGDVNNRYVGMADLRDKVGKDVSREEFDAAIKRFARDQNSGVRVVPVANMKALTERDRAAAVKIGDEDNHMIDVVPEGVVSGNTAGAPAPAPAATTSSLDTAINAARKDMPDGSPGRQTLDKLDRIDRFDPTATSAAADMLDNTAASFRRHASMTLANSPKGSPQANRAEAQLKAADHLENVAKQLRRPTVDARSSATKAVVLQTVAGRQEHIRELEITASKLKPGSSEHSAAMKAIEADRAWIAQHGAGKAPPVASEQAVQSAREQLAAKVTKDLGQAVSKDEARALLAGRTRQELVDIAKAGGTVHPSGATKQQIADTIINNQVGRRLTSDAIRGASRTPGLSVPNVKPQHHAVTAPRTNMVGEMVHQLTQAKTEEDRKRLLDNKTSATLRAIGESQGLNFTASATKQSMIKQILDHLAGKPPGGGAGPKAPSAPERTFLDPFNRLDLKKYAQERHDIDLNQFLDLTRNPLPLAHAPVAEQRPFGYRLQKIIDDAASGNASHNKTISELDKAIHTAKEQVQFIRISDPKRHDNRDKATLEQGPKYIQALGDVVKGLQAEKLPARKTRPTLPPTVAGQLAPVDEGKFSSHPLNDLLSHGGQSLPAGFAHRLERNGLRVASAKNLETNPQRPGLSKEENRALDIWTATPVAGALNGSLRLGHPVHGTQEFPERPDLGKVNLDEVQSQLDRAIQKSELRHDSVLWRGVLVKNADAKRFVPGAVYSDPGFSATSASQNRAERVAERWSREVQHKGSKPVLFKILAPKGTHAALGHQSVEEILLGRDQRFQVVRIEEPTTRDGLPTYVVQALRPDHVEGRDLLASTDFAKLTSNSANLGSGIGGKGPDEALRKILAEQHFDAKPKILTPEEMDHAIKVDGGVELFRAVGAHEEKTPAQLAEEFRSGTLHPGTGVYGSGTYATPERDVTKNYGEEQLRMVLPPSARTVSYPNLVKLRDAQFADLEAQAKALRLDLRKAADDPAKLKAIQAELNHLQARRNVIYNPGRLAALLGYDAIVVPQGFRKGPKSGGASEYVILNRSAMLVEKARKG